MMTTKLPYAGAGIILTRLGEEPRFLLLCGKETGVWSFAKGRPEPNDRATPLRTAVRETHEETGFMAGNHYTLMNTPVRFGKRTYWLGIMRPEAVPTMRIRSTEHSIAGWFTWDEVAQLGGNTDVREWNKKSRKEHGTFMALLNSAMTSVASSGNPDIPSTC
jgi:8-oxo-dGTP pyrophosphatase MutT (NUDIX family)